MISHPSHSSRIWICFILLCGFLLMPSAPLLARESFATHPTLPRGYSSIRVFDSQGRFVGRILHEGRYWVSIDRIPSFLQKALIAVEDARFYEHNGIDMRGIARALVKDVVKGRMAEGGSTITQQLIKNRYLSGEKTLDRKLKEGRMALEFEQKYTKKQILEMYFNEIYFGNGAWGIAQAARLYFDKNPEELTEAECSLLAGVPKAPGVYNPRGPGARVTARRDLVLGRMVELGMISRAKQQKLRTHPPSVIPVASAPSYLAHIRALLVQQYGAGIVERGGLEVTTALDLRLQKLAEKTMEEGLRHVPSRPQGALVCLDPASGDLLAMVGGVGSDAGGYNRALAARRQPGSAIKPLIFAAALEQGRTAADIWDDRPVSYSRGNGGTWKPRNYGGESFGSLSLRQALAYSNNVITVKLLDSIGIPAFSDLATRLGLSLRTHDLTLALGTAEVSLGDLALAYAPLANGGSLPRARSIIRIYDRKTKGWTSNPPLLTPVISPATACVTTQMMRDVMIYGTAKSLKSFAVKRPSAGKTGTTDDYRDAWFLGYTPQLITGIWVGHDRPRPEGRGFTGGAIPAPIWRRFMEQALASRPAADFPRPETVVSVTIDPDTGFLATPDCPRTRVEFFVQGTQPTETCPDHGARVAPDTATPEEEPAADNGPSDRQP